MYREPGSSFEAVVQGFPSGLAGTIGVRIRDNQGADALARTTGGISEDIVGSGVYRVMLVAPALTGDYSIVWDTGGASPIYAVEDLTVTFDLPIPSGPTSTYATQDDVLARAGRLQGVYSVAGKRPNLGDVDAMLDQVSAEIDVQISAAGYDPSLLTAELQDSLRNVAAWAVVVRTLPEASPGDNAVDAIVERGQAILNASGFPSLGTGATNVMESIGALNALQAGAGGGGPGSSAGSFWDDVSESDDLWSRLRRGDKVVLTNGALPVELFEQDADAPQFRRNQSL